MEELQEMVEKLQMLVIHQQQRIEQLEINSNDRIIAKNRIGFIHYD